MEKRTFAVGVGSHHGLSVRRDVATLQHGFRLFQDIWKFDFHGHIYMQTNEDYLVKFVQATLRTFSACSAGLGEVPTLPPCPSPPIPAVLKLESCGWVGCCPPNWNSCCWGVSRCGATCSVCKFKTLQTFILTHCRKIICELCAGTGGGLGAPTLWLSGLFCSGPGASAPQIIHLVSVNRNKTAKIHKYLTLLKKLNSLLAHWEWRLAQSGHMWKSR